MKNCTWEEVLNLVALESFNEKLVYAADLLDGHFIFAQITGND